MDRQEKAKKQRIKRYITWSLLAVLVLLLTVMPLLAQQEEETEGPQASILSAEVQRGSVTTVLRGGGNLEAVEEMNVKLPTGVKITKFLVRNGDTVAKDDPIAAVDPVSVMTAMTQVAETLDYLKEEMADAASETVGTYISAGSGGRIKQVFAQSGDNVQDVMLEHGALAVLSLDGLMAVQLQRSMALTTGESLMVTLSDGTAVTGRVESNRDGIIAVTIEDTGYAVGEKVTVTTPEGKHVGKGELYVHNAWKAIAYTGTISSVYAREETTVSSGSTLFTLTDTEFPAQWQTLTNLHREYEELMQSLNQMYVNGVISAPCGGIVSGIDQNSPYLLAAEATGWEAMLLNTETKETQSKGWTILLLSNMNEYDREECLKLGCTAKTGHNPDCSQACIHSAAAGKCPANTHNAGCIEACDHADNRNDCNGTGSHYPDCIKSCKLAIEESKCPSQKHEKGCIESCVISDGSIKCPATGIHRTDCIENCNAAEKCPGGKNHYDNCLSLCDGTDKCEATNHKISCVLYGSTYTAYAMKVTASGQELVGYRDSATIYQVEREKKGWKLIQPATLNTELLVTEWKVTPSLPVTCQSGDIVLVVTCKKGETVIYEDRVFVYLAAQSGSGTTDNMSGSADIQDGLSGVFGNKGGSGGMAGSGSAAPTEELFDLTGSVLATIIPQDMVTMTISMDEKDISKLSPGQAAQVKVEALRDQLFEAEVSRIAVSGTNNGGSSKFAVELTMKMAENVLPGMSATATIPLYTKTDVLTIPVAALIEQDAKTVVYTALDEKTGAPAQPVAVKTGVSDGASVEIVSGLNIGDRVYYAYYDTLELNHSVEDTRFGR